MSRRLLLARLAAPAAALGLLLAGCGSGSSTTPSSSATSSDLGAVSVSGGVGTKPTVKIPAPFSVKETTTTVLTKGTGAVVAGGQRVTVDYTGYNGTDGKEFDTSFGAGKKSPSFLLDPDESLPGLVKGLVGSTVGSRLLLAIPPADAYGTAG